MFVLMFIDLRSWWLKKERLISLIEISCVLGKDSIDFSASQPKKPMEAVSNKSRTSSIN